MDIVLGVSMTPTTVRMVLVEGEEADGLNVENDVFDITAVDGAPTSSASEQVSSAVLGTQESAAARGHHLIASGVTWGDDAEAAALRECLIARGLEHVTVVSELHAAGALAQDVGRALGYRTTALMLIEPDTVTLSVVETADGSIVKVLSQTLHSEDTTEVLTEMVTSLEDRESLPQGLFVVGSGVDIASAKSHLESLVSLPVSAPEDPELALARGAALASAHAPRFEATTGGLAYSQDPDGATADTTGPLVLADVPTQLGPVREDDADAMPPLDVAARGADRAGESEDARDRRQPFLPVFSVLTTFLVFGVVALVISFAVSIQPTVDQRPSPGEKAIAPSTAAPAPPAVQEAAPAQAPPAVQVARPAPAQPAPEIIPTPVSVPQRAPRTVVVETPAVNAQARASTPQRRTPAPAPVAVDPPVAHAPVAVAPPVAHAPPLAVPVVTPRMVTPASPPSARPLPPLTVPPIYPSPVQGPSGPLSPWPLPSRQQQVPQTSQNPWLQISLWPQQQSPQRQLPLEQQTSPGLQISVLPQQIQQPNPQLPQSPPYPQLPRTPLYPQMPQSPPVPQYPVQQQLPFGAGAGGSYGSGFVSSGGTDRAGVTSSGGFPDGGSRAPQLWPFDGN